MAKVWDLSVSVSDYFNSFGIDAWTLQFFGIFACNSVENATECKPQTVSVHFMTAENQKFLFIFVNAK